MKKSINAWTFGGKLPILEAARQVRTAGFEAFELTLELEGDLTIETGESACKKLAEGVRATGLEIASAACGLFWQASYTSPDPADRERAKAWTRASLQRARWLGTDALLVVPGMVSHFAEPTKLVTPYGKALNLAYDALRELSGDAESYGVVIAIENVWNGFLLSPVEMAGLIDRVGSPWVQAYFDTGNVLKFGFPEDWIDTLGGRIKRVHLKDFKTAMGNIDGFRPLGDGDANWSAIMAALRRCGYDGPLTYEGGGDLADISKRIDRILAS
jgi:L-ribulose-5-phosphate 3-epimerase